MTMDQTIAAVLRRDIKLHEELAVLIREEQSLADEFGSGRSEACISRRHEVEGEIAALNDAVCMLFEHYYTGALAVHPGAHEEIDGLMADLRRAMRDALESIGEAMKVIKRARAEIVGNINGIDTRRRAVSAYRSAV